MRVYPVAPDNQQPLGLTDPGESRDAWRRGAKNIAQVNQHQKQDQSPQRQGTGSVERTG